MGTETTKSLRLHKQWPQPRSTEPKPQGLVYTLGVFPWRREGAGRKGERRRTSLLIGQKDRAQSGAVPSVPGAEVCALAHSEQGMRPN